MKMKETKDRLRKRGFTSYRRSWAISGIAAFSKAEGVWVGVSLAPMRFSRTHGWQPKWNKRLWDVNRRLVEYIEANFEEVM